MKVSDELWEKLEQKLDGLSETKRKTNFIWLNYAAAIILIFGLGGIFWTANNKVEITKNRQLENLNKNQNPIFQSGNYELRRSDMLVESNKIPTEKAPKERYAGFSKINAENQLNKKEILHKNQVSEKEFLIKNDEPKIISQPEEKFAQTEISKPKEKVKYISSSDLLFGVEMDNVKSEKPRSALGFNISSDKENPDILNPKRIKIFGYTIYQKDSLTSK